MSQISTGVWPQNLSIIFKQLGLKYQYIKFSTRYFQQFWRGNCYINALHFSRYIYFQDGEKLKMVSSYQLSKFLKCNQNDN